MVMTLIPFVIICLIVAGIAGSCAFRPGGPSVGEIPRYDAQLALSSQAKKVAFPLRLPATPEGWTTNSGGTVEIANTDGGVAVNLGYVTDRTTFLQITQSGISADMLQQFTASGSRNITGEEVIGDQVWAVFSDADAETLWVAQLPNSSVSITGSGSPEEFSALATAFSQAQPLPTS